MSLNISQKHSLSRRSFVRTTGTAVTALGVATSGFSRARSETLALDGGPASVTIPKDKHKEVTSWPRYGDAEKRELAAVIDRNSYYDELPKFEKAWKEYLGAKFVKSHMNGTSALTSMYFALDLPPGSEVMVPSYTFFATVAPLRFFGLVPIFVDSDPHTCCFDLEDARGKLTSRTKAVVPMHAWGMPAEMDHIMGFAEEHGLTVLEDAAQAAGASMQGKKMGTWGDMAIFSFQASKVLPAIEGGMGIYQTRTHYERAAAYGHYKAPPTFPKSSPYHKYIGTGFGQKFRMHPFGAAVVRKQLEILDERNALVEAQVRQLNDRILQLPGLSEPRIRPDQKRVYYAGNMVFFDEKKAGFSRGALLKALKAEGVRAHTWIYPLQHKFELYHEARWWHHPPKIPAVLPGCEQANDTHVFISLIYEKMPDLIDQYSAAFEKVWANKDKLAKL